MTNRDSRGRFTDGNRPRDPKTGRFVKEPTAGWSKPLDPEDVVYPTMRGGILSQSYEEMKTQTPPNAHGFSNSPLSGVMSNRPSKDDDVQRMMAEMGRGCVSPGQIVPYIEATADAREVISSLCYADNDDEHVHTPVEDPLAQVGPHEWKDRGGHRCDACFLPECLHPVSFWTTARPLDGPAPTIWQRILRFFHLSRNDFDGRNW